MIRAATIMAMGTSAAPSLVTDNFNRADGGLGANWTTDSVSSALVIVSNACKASTASVHNVSIYTASGTIAANQYAQFKVTSTGAFMGPVLRSNGAGTFYTCFYQPTGSSNVTIYKVIGGAYSGLVSGSVVTPTVNDIVYFEAVGTALTMKVNGATVATTGNSDITGAGYAGIDIYDTTAAAVDDFECGPI